MWDIIYKPPISPTKISKGRRNLLHEYLRGKERIHIEVKHGLDDGEDGEDNGGHGDGGEAGHPVPRQHRLSSDTLCMNII